MTAEQKASPRLAPGDASALTIQDWIDLLPIAAWTVDDLRFLLYSNRAARRALGVAEGRDGYWRCPATCPVCGPHRRQGPTLVHWKQAGGLWLEIFALPPLDGVRVHCAVDVTRQKRMEGYLEHSLGEGSHPGLDSLSSRERQILAALAEGSRPEEIARQLCLSKVTVRNHIQHILGKLGLHSTQAAVARWLLEVARAPSAEA